MLTWIVEALTSYIDTNGWWMFLTQVIIAGTGVPAILMTQSTNENIRKWACIVAIAGQPFWFIMAWITGAWGVFIMSFFYTFAWAKGVWSFWLKPFLDSSKNPWRHKQEKRKLLLRFVRTTDHDDKFILEGGGGSVFDGQSLLMRLRLWSNSVTVGEPAFLVKDRAQRSITASEKYNSFLIVLSDSTIKYENVQVKETGPYIEVIADLKTLKSNKIDLKSLRFSPRFLTKRDVHDDTVFVVGKLIAVDYRSDSSAFSEDSVVAIPEEFEKQIEEISGGRLHV